MYDPTTGKWIPIPTQAPQARGVDAYLPMSSNVNSLAQNYVNNAPMSVPNSSAQLNAFGAPLYPNNVWNTNNRVANTNPQTGALIPTPQAGPAPAPTTPPSDGNGDNSAMAEYLASLVSARNYRDRGLQTINDLLASVNAFRDRSKNLYSNADQQITNQAETNLGENATSGQSAVGKINSMGKNLGLSAKMNNAQSLIGNLQRQQGDVVASRGENQRSNQALLDEREDEASSQEKTLNTQRLSLEDAVRDMETSGATNYGNRLSDIQQRAQSLAALSPMGSTNLSAYSPSVSSGGLDILNSLTGNGGTSTSTGNSSVNINNLISDLYKKLRSGQTSGLYQ